ncbi:hypothetical protein BZG36_03413 [Bifiguratus adelaidae]|uniref:RRM domain-containing protein n=1 Tax=Bifiguratus adelaidae TaxID=1938954 RepID=A0A261XYS8_9FUNG|nr:hypothetical protein BZG36_03413 [Bifiguratus adelaidae]
MASSLDMALDDIITTSKSRPKAQRGKGRGNQRSIPYSRGGKGLATKSGASEGSKIMISNLHYNVNEADLRELFEKSVGPLKKVSLSYDKTGRSSGQATVSFVRQKDASVAFKKFNNITLDGRPMKIEILLQNANLVADAGRTVGGRAGQRGRGGRGGRRGGEKKTPKTQEDLDKEMADYMSVDQATAASVEHGAGTA